MSAAHQLKKVREANRFTNWCIGKRRTVDGVVYATIKEARMARNNKRNKLYLKEQANGREEADRSAP